MIFPPFEPGTPVSLSLYDDGDEEVIEIRVPRGQGVAVEHWLELAWGWKPAPVVPGGEA